MSFQSFMHAVSCFSNKNPFPRGHEAEAPHIRYSHTTCCSESRLVKLQMVPLAESHLRPVPLSHSHSSSRGKVLSLISKHFLPDSQPPQTTPTLSRFLSKSPLPSFTFLWFSLEMVLLHSTPFHHIPGFTHQVNVHVDKVTAFL